MVMFDDTAQIILAEHSRVCGLLHTAPVFALKKIWYPVCQTRHLKCLLLPSSPELQHLSDADYTTPSFSEMLGEDSVQPCLFSPVRLCRDRQC